MLKKQKQTIFLLRYSEDVGTDCKNFLTELSLMTDTQVELFESLLKWTKIETGRMEFYPAVYDIG